MHCVYILLKAGKMVDINKDFSFLSSMVLTEGNLRIVLESNDVDKFDIDDLKVSKFSTESGTSVAYR